MKKVLLKIKAAFVKIHKFKSRIEIHEHIQILKQNCKTFPCFQTTFLSSERS